MKFLLCSLLLVGVALAANKWTHTHADGTVHHVPHDHTHVHADGTVHHDKHDDGKGFDNTIGKRELLHKPYWWKDGEQAKGKGWMDFWHSRPTGRPTLADWMQKQKERVDAWKKKFAMDDKEEDETARRFRGQWWKKPSYRQRQRPTGRPSRMNMRPTGRPSLLQRIKQFWSDRREKMKAYLASKKTAVAKDDEDETKRGGNKARGRAHWKNHSKWNMRPTGRPERVDKMKKERDALKALWDSKKNEWNMRPTGRPEHVVKMKKERDAMKALWETKKNEWNMRPTGGPARVDRVKQFWNDRKEKMEAYFASKKAEKSAEVEDEDETALNFAAFKDCKQDPYALMWKAIMEGSRGTVSFPG